MASDISFVEFVCEQLSGAGEITYKKMFGEYGIYCNGQYYAMICDDRFLVKITEAGKQFIPDYKTDFPYVGAKPTFLITELDNRDFLTELTLLTCANLPLPKPKKKRNKK